MNGATIQPTLTPCDGSLDLISNISACGEFIELTWGTTLFMRVPLDRQTATFRILAGLLCRFGFEQEAIAKFLGICSKTVRRWRDCLVEGTWDSLSALFEGVDSRSLPDHLEEYARKRYREFVADGRTAPAHAYNQTIAGEIRRYWRKDACGEVLRRLFREEDELMQAEAAQAQRTEGCESANTSSSESVDVPNDVSVEPERTEDCESEATAASKRELARNDVSAEPERTEPPTEGAIPLFCRELSAPVFSAHAGLAILSPWFEQAFGASQPIVRQTAAQILLGEVNQEQAKNLSFPCLEHFIRNPIRSPWWQRKLLDDAVMADAVSDVWRANAKLIGLERRVVCYVDTHVAVYTGKENYLKTWSGLDKAPKKGVNLDFFHTTDGYPCYIGHDDGYYDPRQRFLMIIQQMRSLTGADRLATFVMDRGYWGQEFMNAMVLLGLHFIQWQKNYKDDGWDQPFTSSGRMSIVRRKNNKHDKKKIRFSYREQAWPAHPNGRRIIVRTSDLNNKSQEFAIVTNDPDLSSQEVIRLMFNRQIQEGDFSYGNRHFGINQQTARHTNPYAQIQNTLEDRQIDSRTYQAHQREQSAKETELGKLLIILANTPNPSPAALKARRKRLSARLDAVSQELKSCAPATTESGFLAKLGRKIARLKTTTQDILRQQQQIDKRRELQSEADQLQQTLKDLDILIRETPRKESRLNRLIQDGKVKPDLGRKALVDAIRITARNTYCLAHCVFRPFYNNYREDHATLRQLTRSPGVITQNADGAINLYLRPELDRQSEQWQLIRTFIAIIEHRIREQFGVMIKIHLNSTDTQIFDAVERMNQRLRSQKQRK